MQGTSASIVTEIGRLRENVRGVVSITVDAVDIVSITYFTGTHTERCTMAGEHWREYVKAVNAADRQVRRNMLKAGPPRRAVSA